jgi:hypothetical protein
MVFSRAFHSAFLYRRGGGRRAGHGLITTQKLSAALANELVGQAVAACAQKNIAVVAVVVDLDGVRQAVLQYVYAGIRIRRAV